MDQGNETRDRSAPATAARRRRSAGPDPDETGACGRRETGPTAPPHVPTRSKARRRLAILLGGGVAACLLVAGIAWGERRAAADERGSTVRVDAPAGVLYGMEGAWDGRGWGPERPPWPRAKGALRVVAVGDSVTYGMNVAGGEAWPARLGTALGVEAVNLGVRGWDAAQTAALVVSAEVTAWAPDLVVWGLYVNDGYPTRVLHAGQGRTPVYVDAEPPPQGRVLPDGPARWLLARSALFRRFQAVAWARARVGERYDEARVREALARVRAWSERSGVPVVGVALTPHVLADAAACERTLGAGCARAREDLRNVEEALAASGFAWVSTRDAVMARGTADFPARAPEDADHPGPATHVVYAEVVAPVVAEILAPRAVDVASMSASRRSRVR